MTITERGSHGSSQVEHRGKGFDGETTLFDVTPMSYAQFGLVPQVHRKERDIYDRARPAVLALATEFVWGVAGVGLAAWAYPR